MPSKSKLELLLTLKNKMKSGMSKARNTLKSKLKGMKSDISSFKNHHIKAFSAMKESVPGLGAAVGLLTNPYALATAAVLALSVAMTQGVQAAGKFNHQFLELQNLNLDKSSSQIQKLNDKILDVALKEGFDSTKTAQAYYDVQSALGVYGDEVDTVVQKVGRFSMATKADFGDSINSTTKAMKAFGFQSNQLDEYLASNAKTVQVGITTFNELAQVQTEYAGAAAAAGQGFNTANKVYAAFTAMAKDGNTAATMTKAAFQGLTMKATIKGLKGVGIELFDAKGKMKDMSRVIEDLVPKIKGMSDTKFLEFRNAIGGPEGLQNLFNQLRTSGDDVLKTMKAFDESKFDVGAALANAKGDFVTLKGIVGNQLNNLMIRLGQEIMPTVIRGLNIVTNVITGMFDFVSTNKETLLAVWTGLKAGVLFAAGAFTILKAGMIASFIANNILIGGLHALKAAIFAIPIVGWIALAITALVVMYQKWDDFRHLVDATWESIKALAMIIKDGFIASIKSAWEVIKSFFSNMWGGMKNLVMGIIEGFGAIGKVIKAAITLDWDGVKSGAKEAGEQFKRAGSGLLNAIPLANIAMNYKEYGKTAADSFNTSFDGANRTGVVEAFKKGKADSIARTNAKKEAGDAQLNPDNTIIDPSIDPSASGASTPTSGSGSIGKATQVKSLVVNIEAIHKGDNIIRKDSVDGADSMSIEAFEDLMHEFGLRLSRNLGTA